jgi:hypothetical protein
MFQLTSGGGGGPRLKHYAISWKVEGSRPDEVNEHFFNLPNPSGRTRPWGLLSLKQNQKYVNNVSAE